MNEPFGTLECGGKRLEVSQRIASLGSLSATLQSARVVAERHEENLLARELLERAYSDVVRLTVVLEGVLVGPVGDFNGSDIRISVAIFYGDAARRSRLERVAAGHRPTASVSSLPRMC
ncbi:hypothetical protein MTO96_014320 [Rhipicephalus appendiculatus]